MSDSFATPWTIATRLLCPWDFPGKNTGVDCHFLLQRNLPDPEIKPTSPALAAGFFTTEPLGKPSASHRTPQRPLQVLMKTTIFLLFLSNLVKTFWCPNLTLEILNYHIIMGWIMSSQIHMFSNPHPIQQNVTVFRDGSLKRWLS